MKTLERLLPMIDAGLCGVTLLLLLADLIWPSGDIFLSEFVKALLLVTCLCSSACGMLLYARMRRRDRTLRRRAR